MGFVLIVLGLVAFGALIGRWWAVIVVAIPVAAVAGWLATLGDIPGHDFTVEGTFLALIVLAWGAVAAGVCSLGVILGRYFRERRRRRP
jgi:hypothetical protein